MVKIELVADTRKRVMERTKEVDDVVEGRKPYEKSMAEHTIIITPEVFAQVFSPQRMRLLLVLSKDGKKNIYPLAKELGRSYEAVHRDVTYLADMGLIRIRKDKRKRIPHLSEPITIARISA